MERLPIESAGDSKQSLVYCDSALNLGHPQEHIRRPYSQLIVYVCSLCACRWGPVHMCGFPEWVFPFLFSFFSAVGCERLTNRWHSYSLATRAQKPVLCQQVSLRQDTEQESQSEKERQRQRETLVIILFTSTTPHINNTSNFVRV